MKHNKVFRLCREKATKVQNRTSGKKSRRKIGAEKGLLLFIQRIRAYWLIMLSLQTQGRIQDFFLGGGALVSCSTSTPINHTVFFLQNTCCIRKPHVISGEGAHPSHPPLDPPLRQRGYLRTRILADNAQVPYLVKDHSGNGVLTRAKTIPYVRLETLNPPGI